MKIVNLLKSISNNYLFGLQFILFISLVSCKQKSSNNYPIKFDSGIAKNQINLMLDSFNQSAAKADFKSYFNFYADDAIFTGTDATERWNKKEFMNYAKPLFDKRKAWSFKSMERHIYFDKTGKTAWFDELLNTQMKICRGSGVLVKEGNSWKLKQYILSATIPNPIMNDVVKMKSTMEDSLINR
jgi:hypothetical protein